VASFAFAIVVAFFLLGSPFVVPAQTPARPAAHPTRPAEVRIDINRASMEELLKIPGMTSTWAARIVRFRPYRTKRDLLDRGVLPSDVYDRIKDSIIAHRNEQ
jgi:DNA uptake protein ComE-like DNA-binding protein